MTKIPSIPDRKRLICLALCLFALFSILITQFYRIQIIEGDKWSKVAKRQHYFVVNEPFLRGTFFSNTSIKQGHPQKPQKLVVDIQKFHLYIDPISIPKNHRRQISAHLLSTLDLSVGERLALENQFNKKSRSRKLAMWLDKDARDTILEWWLPFAKKNKIARNAVYFVSDYQRSYPFGKLLGQVLHTIQNHKDELTNQAIPTGGLELHFNEYLKGKQGKRRLMRSPRNAFETGEIISLPQNGSNIFLTINHALQTIAEDEIAKGVKKANAKAGWAIIMNPYTGEILALAQYPHFYPPEYQNYFNDKNLIEHTYVKAITDANEPGSVMKPFTLAVALKANQALKDRGEKPLFSPTDKIPTSNSHFKGRSKPLKDMQFHKYLNMEMAIQKSSNIYVARLVEGIITRLGKEWYRDVLQNSFGFGVKTGIELPAESSGVLPLPGKLHPNGALEWSGATPYSLAIGHNIQATSLQLIRGYAIFANGGYLVDPTLVRKIVRPLPDGQEEVLVDNTTEERIKKFPRVMESEMVAPLVRAMKYATKPGGTARRADIWGYTEAGKTGTANKIINGAYSSKLSCSTFIGFTPVSKPAFVLLVTMDGLEYNYLPGIGKVHHGGVSCTPVFKEIATRALDYLGIPPDDPHGYPAGDPRADPKKADWMPEVRKLQEMYDSWNK